MPWILPAALALTALGTIGGVYAQQQQLAAQREARNIQTAQANVVATRERYQQIREARIRRAQIVQAGENQGAGQSSGVAGGVSGVQSQAFQNIAFVNDQQSAGQAIARAQQQSLNAQGLGSIAGGVSAIGGTIFEARNELKDIEARKELKDIFS